MLKFILVKYREQLMNILFKIKSDEQTINSIEIFELSNNNNH